MKYIPRALRYLRPYWKLASISHMGGFDHQPERTWDEYDWERFLQQQDHKTEKYMELLEKYLDDPNRDQIIAREMGWPHLLEPTSDELEEIEFEGDSADESEEDLRETFESHPLYQSAFSLTVWIDQLFDEAPIAASNSLGRCEVNSCRSDVNRPYTSPSTVVIAIPRRASDQNLGRSAYASSSGNMPSSDATMTQSKTGASPARSSTS